MVANAFVGSTAPPSDEDLSAALGAARAPWDRLVADLAAAHGVEGQEWSSYSRKAGWSMKLKRGDRVIVYLSPCRGCFLASFALGEKAIAAARASRLPDRVLSLLDGAKRYAEGAAVRIEVKGARDLGPVKKIAAAKIAN